MLLNNGSLILIFLVTGYNIFYALTRREAATKKLGMVIAVILALVASGAFSMVFAQTFEYKLFLSMGVAILFSIIAGFLAGKIYSLPAALNGALAGWLAAMLGTYLGTVLFATNKVILVVDTLFIVFMYLLQKLIEWQSNKQTEGKKDKKHSVNVNKSTNSKAKIAGYYGTIGLAACVIILAVTIAVEKDHIKVGQLGQPQTQLAVYDEKNDLQNATIDVTASGLSPKNTEFKEKTMIKAIFNLKPNAGTGLTIKSTDLDISMVLKEGSNIVLMNNPQVGVYKYTLEPGDFKGTFTVK